MINQMDHQQPLVHLLDSSCAPSKGQSSGINLLLSPLLKSSMVPTPEPALKPLAPFSYCVLTSLHSSVSHMIYVAFREQHSMTACANPSVQKARPEALSPDTASSCPILSVSPFHSALRRRDCHGRYFSLCSINLSAPEAQQAGVFSRPRWLAQWPARKCQCLTARPLCPKALIQ